MTLGSEPVEPAIMDDGSTPVGAKAGLREDGSSPLSNWSAEELTDGKTEEATPLLEWLVGDGGTMMSGRP